MMVVMGRWAGMVSTKMSIEYKHRRPDSTRTLMVFCSPIQRALSAFEQARLTGACVAYIDFIVPRRWPDLEFGADHIHARHAPIAQLAELAIDTRRIVERLLRDRGRLHSTQTTTHNGHKRCLVFCLFFVHKEGAS